MRDLTDKETAYFRFLPMVVPLRRSSERRRPSSRNSAAASRPRSRCTRARRDVTVAEGNRAVLDAFHSEVIRNFTGDILSQGAGHRLRGPPFPRPHRRALRRHRPEPCRFGRAVQSRRLRHRGEILLHEGGDGDLHARAGADGGVLSVTLWNKEEPPKSVLKLYATMAARRARGRSGASRQFLLRRLVLSLDRDGALQERRLHRRRNREAAHAHARHVVRRDLFARLVLRPLADRSHARRLCRSRFSPARRAARRRAVAGERSSGDRRSDRAADARRATRRSARRKADDGVLPATVMGRLAWHALIHGHWPEIAVALCLRHARADQRRALFRRLREDRRPAARPRPARTAAGRVGLSPDLGDARRRLRDRDGAAGHSVDLGLARRSSRNRAAKR